MSRTPANGSARDAETPGGPARGIGYVYLIQEDGSECYKIGKTGRLNLRLATLMSNHGKRLTLLHNIRSTSPDWLERTLHSHFRKQRLRGEWFRLSSEDVVLFRLMDECCTVGELPPQLQVGVREPETRWDSSAQPPSGFGIRLRALRQEARLSVPRLAAMIGCSAGNIYMLEHQKHEPGWQLALAISRILGVDVSAFVPKQEGILNG